MLTSAIATHATRLKMPVACGSAARSIPWAAVLVRSWSVIWTHDWVFGSCTSSIPGAFGAGALAKAVGVQWAIGGGAAAMLLYAIWAFRRVPELTAV